MIVNVTDIDIPAGVTVGVATGRDAETGKEIRFGIDHRVANDLIGLLSEEGEVACEVEGWQILGSSS